MKSCSTESRLRLLIVDDQTLFREGLASLFALRPRFEVVGQACGGEDAIRQALSARPDIILMDLMMPGMDGIEATREITSALSETRVIMLTVSAEKDDLFEAIKAGAVGYILKSCSAHELFSVVEKVAAGEAVLNGRLALRMLKEFAGSGLPGPGGMMHQEELTEREVQVLRLLASGASNKEIGSTLFISENTVKKHIYNILAKLHVKNRVEAAAYAIRQGLVEWRNGCVGDEAERGLG